MDSNPKLADLTEEMDELYRRHSERVYRLVRRHVTSDDEATDLTQDVFVKAFQALPEFKGKSAVSTWITRIALNVCVDAGHQAARRASAGDPEKIFAHTVIDSDIASRMFEDQQLVALSGVLTTLDPDILLLVSLKYSDRLSYPEIAEIIGMKPWEIRNKISWVRTRISRALHSVHWRSGGAAAAYSLDDVLVNSKGAGAAYQKLGELYLRKGLVEAALREWQKACNLSPNSIEPWLHLADQYTLRGRPQDAVQLLESVVDRFQSGILHTKLGQGYLEMGDHDRAGEHCGIAINMDPTDPFNYCVAGKIHRRAAVTLRHRSPHELQEPADSPFWSRLQHSRDFLQSALGIDPSRLDCVNELAGTLAYQGDETGASEMVERLIAQLPDPDIAYGRAGHVNHILGNIRLAAESYEHALTYAESGWVRVRAAELRNQLGELSTAQTHLDLAEIPGDEYEHEAMRLCGRAGIAIGRGNIKSAVELCEQSMKLEDQLVLNRCRLATSRALGGNLQGAEDSVREIERLEGHHNCIHWIKSRIHYGRGEYQAALLEAESAIYVAPDNPDNQTQIALCLESIGEVDQARSILDHVISAHAEQTEAIEIRQTLGTGIGRTRKLKDAPHIGLAHCQIHRHE